MCAHACGAATWVRLVYAANRPARLEVTLSSEQGSTAVAKRPTRRHKKSRREDESVHKTEEEQNKRRKSLSSTSPTDDLGLTLPFELPNVLEHGVHGLWRAETELHGLQLVILAKMSATLQPNGHLTISRLYYVGAPSAATAGDGLAPTGKAAG